jgi:hypothetical protein
MTTNSSDEAEHTRQAFDDLRAQIESLRQEQSRLDAALRRRTTLDDDKLRADIDKAVLDGRKLQSELDPSANNYERGIKELAKLDAEKRKLDYEFDPAANDYERGIKELAKLDAEKAKLDAEKSKLGSDQVAEWFKTIGTMLLAGAAILTWWITSNKNEQERDARYRADAAHLIESLGVPQAPQLRAAAAVGLRSFIADERTRALVIGSLAYSLGIESQVDVQHAMADSLVTAGQDAVPLLNQMISRVNGEVKIGFDRLGDMPNCRGHEKELDPMTAQQNAITAAVLALRRLSPGSPAPDFSELNFKCFKLHPLGDQLRGAIFRKTTLWSADFYNMDLQGSDFSEAHAFGAMFNRATLKGVNFSRADLGMAGFTDASLDNAQFTDADLDGADLSEATGLSEPQLMSAAHLSCAKLPAALANAMAQRLQPPPGRSCR